MNKKDKVFVGRRKIFTSFIQKLPFAKKYFRIYFPLFPIALYFFNFKKYDIVISSSHSYAKNINKLNASQIHICYCHTPIRYCYDMKKQYIEDYAKKNIPLKLILNFILSLLGIWDKQKSRNVDSFISNSKYIQNRIKYIYHRDSKVIYPSIDFNKYAKKDFMKSDYYVAASRFVPYKKIDLVISLFNEYPEKKLVIIGDGEKFDEYKILSKSKKIIFLGWISEEEKISVLGKAKALIYPALEDFGIVPIEAQACGTPVIGFGEGGLKDTVITEGKFKTGIFFPQQTKESIMDAINYFEKNSKKFTPENCKKNVLKFDKVFFAKNFKSHMNKLLTTIKL